MTTPAAPDGRTDLDLMDRRGNTRRLPDGRRELAHNTERRGSEHPSRIA